MVEENFYRNNLLCALNSDMQNFSDLVQENIFKFEVEWTGVEKMCVFQRKTGHISETVKDTAKVTVNY